jgi:hypothetical protein
MIKKQLANGKQKEVCLIVIHFAYVLIELNFMMKFCHLIEL